MRVAIYAAAAILVALCGPAAASGAGQPLPRIPAPEAQIIEMPCPEESSSITSGACAYPDGRMYLPPGWTAFMREHELGHIFDAQRLDDGERQKLRGLLGVAAAAPWRVNDPFRSASELFADAYAACRLGLDPDHRWETSYDYWPSASDFRRMCTTIARAADYGPAKGLLRR